ncbi:GNAT family N-acetyltransferase [Miniphocaeibacter massiliensis]|uniref:GNAT family N-acetyltransferase n=1 Tax=Miniphocaeibacter massiliensis TaxID=2041841 RepID=UPI001A911735|nr:GNAT family N-acetyltransferase [Miniphocaeibacter massiliensis]
MILETKRLILSSPKEVSEIPLTKYLNRNKLFLREFEPLKPENYYTEEFQKSLLTIQQYEWNNGQNYKLYISTKLEKDKIIGFVSLSNVVMGAFCSCFLGYQLDKDYCNNGYMTEAVKEVVNFAFNKLHLHRIEGNVMPKNIPSIKVLEKCGFVNEVISKNYLKINGIWEDHIHFVKLNHSL